MNQNLLNVQVADEILQPGHWRRRQEEHLAELEPVLDPYLKKRSEHVKDPVLDFLFEYYKFRPSHLARWSPGFGVGLVVGDNPLPEISELSVQDGLAFLDPAFFPDNRRSSLRWILNLLESTLDSKPSFGCFGMHEWAMVYKAGNVRHSHLPLRMDADRIAEFVESRPLLCTHFDAFRFFTEKARPMNRFELSRETFSETEQPGCIHTNMDLYKWGYKFYPWISSSLIRKAFLFAVEARTVDMQASPYDLRSEGLEPIRIESKAGRAEYKERQQDLFEKSMSIRKALIGEYRLLLDRFNR